MNKFNTMIPLTFLSFFFVGAVNADETITCPSTINQDIDDSVTLTGQGTCTLTTGTQITNDVTVLNNVSFTVKGVVDGKIDEVGAGRVVVDGGTINNDIIESGAGTVEVKNAGLVRGKIDESGSGWVEVNNGRVENDILESDSGSISVINGSFVSGNVDESDGGSVVVDITSRVEGNVFEEGQGNCTGVVTASVEGVVDCD